MVRGGHHLEVGCHQRRVLRDAVDRDRTVAVIEWHSALLSKEIQVQLADETTVDLGKIIGESVDPTSVDLLADDDSGLYASKQPRVELRPGEFQCALRHRSRVPSRSLWRVRCKLRTEIRERFGSAAERPQDSDVLRTFNELMHAVTDAGHLYRDVVIRHTL